MSKLLIPIAIGFLLLGCSDDTSPRADSRPPSDLRINEVSTVDLPIAKDGPHADQQPKTEGLLKDTLPGDGLGGIIKGTVQVSSPVVCGSTAADDCIGKLQVGAADSPSPTGQIVAIVTENDVDLSAGKTFPYELKVPVGTFYVGGTLLETGGAGAPGPGDISAAAPKEATVAAGQTVTLNLTFTFRYPETDAGP